jgi:hypothetical protein
MGKHALKDNKNYYLHSQIQKEISWLVADHRRMWLSPTFFLAAASENPDLCLLQGPRCWPGDLWPQLITTDYHHWTCKRPRGTEDGVYLNHLFVPQSTPNLVALNNSPFNSHDPVGWELGQDSLRTAHPGSTVLAWMAWLRLEDPRWPHSPSWNSALMVQVAGCCLGQLCLFLIASVGSSVFRLPDLSLNLGSSSPVGWCRLVYLVAGSPLSPHRRYRASKVCAPLLPHSTGQIKSGNPDSRTQETDSTSWYEEGAPRHTGMEGAAGDRFLPATQT